MTIQLYRLFKPEGLCQLLTRYIFHSHLYQAYTRSHTQIALCTHTQIPVNEHLPKHVPQDKVNTRSVGLPAMQHTQGQDSHVATLVHVP